MSAKSARWLRARTQVQEDRDRVPRLLNLFQPEGSKPREMSDAAGSAVANRSSVSRSVSEACQLSGSNERTLGDAPKPTTERGV